jgi:hypothetical protein
MTPEAFENVRATTLANVYFDGRVISHAITLPDGSRKTLGLIFAGTYQFSTGAPENMAIIAGACRAKLPGGEWRTYGAGEAFDVPGHSSFEIAVDEGIAQYVCSYE